MSGHVDATWCMGQLYALGQGVPRDEEAAARCYAAAAVGRMHELSSPRHSNAILTLAS